MASKQRVFSHLTDINYNDYIKNKIGIEVLKNIKSSQQNANTNIDGFVIKKFASHSDLINLTKSYYNYYNLDNYSLQATKDLNNSNNSYVDSKVYKNRNGSTYVNDCSNSKFYNVCIDTSQVLYPYGAYTSNTVKPYLHFNLDLNKWCAKKNITDYNSIYNLDNINIDGFNGCNENDDICYNVGNRETTGNINGDVKLNETKKNKCKTGLCKNAKPLFI